MRAFSVPRHIQSQLISLTFRFLQELLCHGIGGRCKKLMAVGVQVIVRALGFRTEQIHSSQRVGTNGNRSNFSSLSHSLSL
jgi:hypothetical protein